jgi:hypothetical protein
MQEGKRLIFARSPEWNRLDDVEIMLDHHDGISLVHFVISDKKKRTNISVCPLFES